MIEYMRGCRKEMEVVQCDERQGSNVRCHPLEQVVAKYTKNYCRGHLVKPTASQKYYSNGGQGAAGQRWRGSNFLWLLRTIVFSLTDGGPAPIY